MNTTCNKKTYHSTLCFDQKIQKVKNVEIADFDEADDELDILELKKDVLEVAMQ